MKVRIKSYIKDEIAVDVDASCFMRGLRDEERPKLLKWIEEEFGVTTVPTKDTDDYVNIKKSMGTEPFYDLLVKAIEDGQLSLEMLIGKVAVKKILNATEISKTTED